MPVGVAHYENQLPLVVGPTPQSKQTPTMAFEFNMIGTHHMVNQLGYMHSKFGYLTSHMHVSQFCICVYVCICFNPKAIAIPSCKFRTKTNNFTSCPNLLNLALQLLDLLKICWSNSIFIPTLSYGSWLLHACGQST